MTKLSDARTTTVLSGQDRTRDFHHILKSNDKKDHLEGVQQCLSVHVLCPLT